MSARELSPLMVLEVFLNTILFSIMENYVVICIPFGVVQVDEKAPLMGVGKMRIGVIVGVDEIGVQEGKYRLFVTLSNAMRSLGCRSSL